LANIAHLCAVLFTFIENPRQCGLDSTRLDSTRLQVSVSHFRLHVHNLFK